MKVIVMAGGRGTRIASLNLDLPKPMFDVAGRPVVARTVDCLQAQGFTDITLTLSYKPEKIMEYFGDAVKYFVEEEPLGNAGAIPKLGLEEDFLLLNADSVLDVNFRRMAEYHEIKGGKATVFTHPNSHPYDSGLIVADENCRVQQWIAKEEPHPQWYRNRVNAGIHILSPELFTGKTGKLDLDRDILRPLAGTGELFCYDSAEYVKDMGTPERYAAVCADVTAGRLTRQKAVFLDRDGTLNRYRGFLSDINDFELLPGTAEALKMINNSEYLAVVVSNQPVIARGELSFAGLEEIHNKMETLLGQQGAYVDRIYFCPHHPDKGFPGEVPELKTECICRKPKPGMLFRAAEELNLDLSASVMIGDSESDILAGASAGCRTIQIERDGDLCSALKSFL